MLLPSGNELTTFLRLGCHVRPTSECLNLSVGMLLVVKGKCICNDILANLEHITVLPSPPLTFLICPSTISTLPLSTSPAPPTTPPPAPFGAHRRPSGTLEYTVEEGDTLNTIALKFDMTASQLAQLNRYGCGTVVHPGMVSTARGGSTCSGVVVVRSHSVDLL